MKITESQIIERVTHSQCQICGALTEVSSEELTALDVNSADEFVENMPALCCNDPYPAPMIVTENAMFPPDEPGSLANSGYWNNMEQVYRYHIDDDFLHLLREDGILDG